MKANIIGHEAQGTEQDNLAHIFGDLDAAQVELSFCVDLFDVIQEAVSEGTDANPQNTAMLY